MTFSDMKWHDVCQIDNIIVSTSAFPFISFVLEISLSFSTHCNITWFLHLILITWQNRYRLLTVSEVHNLNIDILSPSGTVNCALWLRIAVITQEHFPSWQSECLTAKALNIIRRMGLFVRTVSKLHHYVQIVTTNKGFPECNYVRMIQTSQ